MHTYKTKKKSEGFSQKIRICQKHKKLKNYEKEQKKMGGRKCCEPYNHKEEKKSKNEERSTKGKEKEKVISKRLRG